MEHQAILVSVQVVYFRLGDTLKVTTWPVWMLEQRKDRFKLAMMRAHRHRVLVKRLERNDSTEAEMQLGSVASDWIGVDD